MILMAEAVEHVIWGVLFSWPRPVCYFSVLPARESQLSFSAAARKLALFCRSTEKYTHLLLRDEGRVKLEMCFVRHKSATISYESVCKNNAGQRLLLYDHNSPWAYVNILTNDEN